MCIKCVCVYIFICICTWLSISPEDWRHLVAEKIYCGWQLCIECEFCNKSCCFCFHNYRSITFFNSFLDWCSTFILDSTLMRAADGSLSFLRAHSHGHSALFSNQSHLFCFFPLLSCVQAVHRKWMGMYRLWGHTKEFYRYAGTGARIWRQSLCLQVHTPVPVYLSAQPIELHANQYWKKKLLWPHRIGTHWPCLDLWFLPLLSQLPLLLPWQQLGVYTWSCCNALLHGCAKNYTPWHSWRAVPPIKCNPFK